MEFNPLYVYKAIKKTFADTTIHPSQRLEMAAFNLQLINPQYRTFHDCKQEVRKFFNDYHMKIAGRKLKAAEIDETDSSTDSNISRDFSSLRISSPLRTTPDTSGSASPPSKTRKIATYRPTNSQLLPRTYRTYLPSHFAPSTYGSTLSPSTRLRLPSSPLSRRRRRVP